MGVVIFNGTSSVDLGAEVEIIPGYETPEKDYDIYHVPGRNGDVYIDNGSYKNTSRMYYISIPAYSKNFVSIANSISEWLHPVSGYARLEDSYEPDYYRLAVCKNGLEISNLLNEAARIAISFDCKPQRFLKSGDRSIIFTKSGELRNPTNFKALPIITVKGSGNGILRVGAHTITISNIDTELTINSEVQDAYYGTSNRNSVITLSNGFPKLMPGLNEISFSGGITSLEVMPKWWTL